MKKLALLLIIVSLWSLFLVSCETTEESQTNAEEKEGTLSHTLDFSSKNIDDEYLKSQASCSESMQYYCSCSCLCGDKSEETSSELVFIPVDLEAAEEPTRTEEPIESEESIEGVLE